ncbi:MAG: Arc family DNA-binding protein [Oscillospiraceae bacterium]|nr:Arc family DNA-binding protein [Oscillospiraceae bacterium]
MSGDKVQTGLRIEEIPLIKITHIAKKNRRSLNAQLEFLVEKCIEEYEEEHSEIQVSEEERYKYRR